MALSGCCTVAAVVAAAADILASVATSPSLMIGWSTTGRRSGCCFTNVSIGLSLLSTLLLRNRSVRYEKI